MHIHVTVVSHCFYEPTIMYSVESTYWIVHTAACVWFNTINSNSVAIVICCGEHYM